MFAILERGRDSEGCEQSRRRMQCHGTNDYAERHPYEISFLSFKTILCFEEKLKSSLSSHCQTAPAVTTSTTLDTIGGFQVASFNFPKFAFQTGRMGSSAESGPVDFKNAAEGTQTGIQLAVFATDARKVRYIRNHTELLPSSILI